RVVIVQEQWKHAGAAGPCPEFVVYRDGRYLVFLELRGRVLIDLFHLSLVLLGEDQFVPIGDQFATLLNGPRVAADRIAQHDALTVDGERGRLASRLHSDQREYRPFACALAPGVSAGPGREDASVNTHRTN